MPTSVAGGRDIDADKVIQDIATKRKQFLHGLDANKGDINLEDIFSDFYPDEAHFVFELLQNAEDAVTGDGGTGATTATFTLSKNECIFEHDGRPFDRDDVRSITGINNTTKKDAPDQIGKFGIGFKSVFVYSLTPEVHSGNFNFKIVRQLVPERVSPDDELGSMTRFRLPFDSPERTPATAFDEIRNGLNRLPAMTLLFLSHLHIIRWHIPGASGKIRRIQHSKNHFEVVKQLEDNPQQSAHFLKFEQPVEGLTKQCVTVAFPLGFLPKVTQFDQRKPLAKQFNIIPAKPGRVAVYFPAEKETSGLRFHLHAPFVPELSRASIKGTSANDPLFEQLAALAGSALHEIRDLGFLTRNFLGVLPNPHDEIPERYAPIRTAIIEEMKAESLTPTHSGSHAPAEHLLQAEDVLKSLLSKEDIEFLREEEPCDWAVAATRKNSEVDHFLEGLEIETWGVQEFVELIEERARNWCPDEDFIEWLAKKPIDWHQQLYALLYRELRKSDDLDRLSRSRIVRLSDGTHAAADECYFPSEGVEHDETHPRVDQGVYTSGKNKKEQAAAKKFLMELGVREVGEAEEVQAILDQRYSEDAIDENGPPVWASYIRDLKRFIALVEEDSENARLFEEYFIFECDDGDWGQPRKIYLDRPFSRTGLKSFYASLDDNDDEKRFALSERYNGKIAKNVIVRFAKAVGVPDTLTIETTGTRDHIAASELRQDSGNEHRKTVIDENWTIAGLEQAITCPSKELAKLLWTAMPQAAPKILKARYRPNKQFKVREQPSSLVLLLRMHAWIPQGRKDFVRPADALRQRLPKALKEQFDSEAAWIQAIGFAENDAKRIADRREKQAFAKKLGFRSIEDLERAQQFTALSREDQERILNETSHNEASQNDDIPGENDRRHGRTGGAGSRKGRGGSGDGTRSGGNGAATKKSAKRSSRRNQREEFVSYVAVSTKAKEPDPDSLSHEQRMTLEEKAIQLILHHEPELNRTRKNNRGFDLFEEKNQKKIRWVEVKAMTGCLDDRSATLSHTQFECAQEHGDDYWLYIVEHADDEQSARILCIQDPAGKTQTFTFDSGWIQVAELKTTDR